MTQILREIKIWRLLIIICLTVTIGLYLIKPIYLLKPFKLGLICKVCATPNLNQTIAIKLAGENVTTLAKVIAKPLDTVEISNGQLSLNKSISELLLPASFNYSERRNEEFEFFVIIYNQNLSKIIDYGRVKQSRIIGKVVFLW